MSGMLDGTKRLVRARTGRLPPWEWRLRALRAPRTIALFAAERREVHQALAAVGKVPWREVATIIPTYRRGESLLVAIESALAQTFTDQTVVVVDDGGGLPANLPDDPRLVAFSLSRNHGTAGVTRNVGIRVSRSRYLAFLDDDNVWEPNHLEVSVAAHRAGAELTYTALRRMRDDGSLIDIFSVPFDRSSSRDYAFTDTSAIVVDRSDASVFSRVPRGMGDIPGEDWEFSYRLSRKLRTEHLPIPTVRYRVHDGSYYNPAGRDECLM